MADASRQVRPLHLADPLPGLPPQQQQLLPRAEGGDADLLQVLVGQGGEGGQVDLVPDEDLCVPEGRALHTAQYSSVWTDLERPWLASRTGRPSPRPPSFPNTMESKALAEWPNQSLLEATCLSLASCLENLVTVCVV